MSKSSSVHAVGNRSQYGEHNMGFRHLTSGDVGRLQPVILQECVEGDVINLNMAECVATSAPNVAPLQGKFKMNVAAFYVPLRVVWDKANEYFTGQADVNIPSFPLSDIDVIGNLIPDYAKTDFYAYYSALGLPVGKYIKTKTATSVSPDNVRSLNASILPFRCLRRIWWDWYRDPNVIPDSNENAYLFKSGTSEALTNYTRPEYATWKHSYISNTLRNPNADTRVMGSGYNDAIVSESCSPLRVPSSSGVYDIRQVQTLWDREEPSISVLDINPAGPSDDKITRPFSADSQYVNSASQVNVQSLRLANAMNNWLMKCSVLGGRLIDRMRGMFGSRVSPLTLQMSEFLGKTEFDLATEQQASQGTTSTADGTDINYNPFGSTDIAKGTMAGQSVGKSTMTKNGLGGVHYKCDEKGYFIVISWILPDAMICEGIAPHWFRGVEGIAPSRFDFLTDEFVGTGFDPLYSYEVFLPPSSLTDTNKKKYDPFNALGFRGKYENYKYNKDIVSGCFVDPASKTSMRPWWLGRDPLREYGCTDASGALKSGVDGDTIVENINHDTLSQMRVENKQIWDDVFVVPSQRYDHWVLQWNIDLKMVRRIGAINAPRIEMQSPVVAESSGSHL